MNADSYALFGAVCDAEVARLRKRALMEGDVVCPPFFRSNFTLMTHLSVI